MRFTEKEKWLLLAILVVLLIAVFVWAFTAPVLKLGGS